MVKSVNQQTKTIGHVQGEAIGDDSNKRTRLNSFCQIRVKDRSMRKTTLLSSEKCATSNFFTRARTNCEDRLQSDVKRPIRNMKVKVGLYTLFFTNLLHLQTLVLTPRKTLLR